jgi:hypothetical protein
MKDTQNLVDVFYVPTDVVPRIWDEVAPIMEESIATSRGNFLPQDVFAQIMENYYMLWVVTIDGEIVAGITTRVMAYPNSKSLSLDWIGGRQMRKWLPLVHNLMLDHAKANGCTQMEGYGRKAWGRWLKKYGWEPNYIAFRVEIERMEGSKNE